MSQFGDRVVFWHRRDLRGVDNRGLATASTLGEVVPVFCLDDELLEFAGAARVAFMLEALADLRRWYREQDSDLVVVRGKPSAVVPQIARDYDADAVIWNEDYSGYAQERDGAVEDALSADGTSVRMVEDLVLHGPGSIRTNAGEPYSVFTYYWKKWRDREKDPAVNPPGTDSLAEVDGEQMPTLDHLGFDDPAASIPAGTRSAALDRLSDFLAEDVYEYDDQRDVPAAEGTSRLSQDLKFGLLGIREVYERTATAGSEASAERVRDGVTEFQQQLAWREFYTQVLTFNPETVTANFKEYSNDIEWRSDDEDLAAWKRGETGYPIVDAGMRQLLDTGYMHNRVRMIVASFLTKDLRIDWREGYDWFRRRLVDHDTANDVGGWQWAASTGTDAQPYFRIFNPMTQGERYDPDAEYITTYVPELTGVAPETIHAWDELDADERKTRAPSYPAPIVDHTVQRTAAIEMFERARGED